MERRLAAIMAADMVGFSRLMEKDQDGVLRRQKAYRAELIDPEIARNRGRIFKTTGDGLLVEFSSAQDAVRCAIDVQSAMVSLESESENDDRIQYRIGVNLGDVVIDGDDVFGDGVNVAARLEGLAVPGGVAASDIVMQTVQERISEPFRDLGSQRVKNLSRPIKVWQWSPDAPPPREVPKISKQQRVKYCFSKDGTQIAYASVGRGTPVLKAPNWMNHLDYEWQSPIWRSFLDRFASQNQLVRFDQRGNGLSDWDPPRISVDAMIDDMEAVVAAARLKRFALYGISQGAAFSVRYAYEHPDEVSCLIFFGGFARGRLHRNNEHEQSYQLAANTLIEQGWGSPNPMFRNFFTDAFFPDAPKEVKESFDEMQRMSCSPERALQISMMNADVNVSEMATKLDVPTLVINNKDDGVCPVTEGRTLARLIPRATFIEFPGNEHILREGPPYFDQFFEEVSEFLAEHN